MRYAFASLALAVIGVLALLPADGRAGPFKYRGGPWDRWVASGYSTKGSTYCSSPTRDDPGLPASSQSYYYPTYPNIPWEYSTPGRDDAPLAGVTPRVYGIQNPGIPWQYTSPSRSNPESTYFYPRSPTPQIDIPWKLTSPSRDNPE
jgi:hypothetical protein